jgi:hypothetical protein
LEKTWSIFVQQSFRESDFFVVFKNIFGELQRVGESLTYVAHLVFLKDVWIRNRELL